MSEMKVREIQDQMYIPHNNYSFIRYIEARYKECLLFDVTVTILCKVS